MISLAPPAGRVSSVQLPLAYLGTAAAAFALAGVALPGLGAELAGHYYHPRLLALTHVLALGWITLAIFGATYQLVPVVIERPLWSDRLAALATPRIRGGDRGDGRALLDRALGRAPVGGRRLWARGSWRTRSTSP